MTLSQPQAQRPYVSKTMQLLEPVRHKQIFLVRPTSPTVNDHWVELLAPADACRRAAAARITASTPYFGYGRADKRHRGREPIVARAVANLLQAVGMAHLVTDDLHTRTIDGFFHGPVDSLTAVPTLCYPLRHRLPSDTVVVSPDAGRALLPTRYAQCLGVPAIVLLFTNARGQPSHPGLRDNFVIETLHAAMDWPQLHVISIAPVVASAVKRLLATAFLPTCTEETVSLARLQQEVRR